MGILLFAACSTRSALSPPPTESPAAVADSAGADTVADTVSATGKPSENTAYVQPVIVGIAIENGDLAKAKSLAPKLPDTPAGLLVKARLLTALHDYEGAVAAYHAMTDAVPEFERTRVSALSFALFSAGRADEAASQLDILLRTDKALPQSERFELRMRWAEFLYHSEKYEDSLKVLMEAGKEATRPAERSAHILLTAKNLLSIGKKDEASANLENAILKSADKVTVVQAVALLKEAGLTPKWRDEQRLSIADRLAEGRAFDAAEEMLKSIDTPKLEEEVQFALAKLLFKRRGHYKEAAQAFRDLAAKGGRHADEAAFMAARALSRLDRDEEAVKAYLAYAAKTKQKAKAHEARFLAARLNFYLGRHQAALAAFERLVGKGTEPSGKQKSLNSPSDTRDAHFMAGLSALSLARPNRATPHFVAASAGTNNAEVLRRNEYWAAAAAAEMQKKAGFDALSAVCEKDPTDWYALLAAERLTRAGRSAAACALSKPAPAEAEPSVDFDGGVEGDADEEQDATREGGGDLARISKTAALYAEAGFYKDAAHTLREAESRGLAKRSTEEWIALYMSLQAPQFAISKASAKFRWPPTDRPLAEAAYPMPYSEVFAEVTKRHALPDMLLAAIARKESLFDPKAVSRVGAMGLMQMMPKTYEANRKQAGLSPLPKGALPGPEDSIRAAGFEFKALFDTFGSLPLAVMAYNAGPAAVSRWLDRSGGLPLDIFVEKAGFAETRNYVRRVIKNLVRYRYIYGGEPVTLPHKAEKSK